MKQERYIVILESFCSLVMWYCEQAVKTSHSCPPPGISNVNRRRCESAKERLVVSVMQVEVEEEGQTPISKRQFCITLRHARDLLTIYREKERIVKVLNW